MDVEASKTWKYGISERPFTVEGSSVAAVISCGRIPKKVGQERACMERRSDPEHQAGSSTSKPSRIYAKYGKWQAMFAL